MDLRDELVSARRALAVKTFELGSLVDVSRELAGGSSEEAIHGLIATGVMAHFVVSRYALFLSGPQGLSLAHGRGLRRAAEAVPAQDVHDALPALAEPMAVAELPRGPLRSRLEENRLAFVVPLSTGHGVEGVLAIGERASGTPFSKEDAEIAAALGRHALAALENARLQRVREEKLRQDRELQIARAIQASLFPSRAAELLGFELAAESHPCHAVGGDSYDWIPLGPGRVALVVADVSGKGTPASLLMAWVHAAVHVLAGSAPPAALIERLNRFLFEKTDASRFVTLFYAELDAASRRLTYVNGGHIPPYRVARNGDVSRLPTSGFALGLLPEASYEAGEVRLEPDDVLAIVTDGVTEATALDEREFGDDGVGEALRRLAPGSAAEICSGLVRAANEWAGPAGCHDDLTALILKAR